MRKLMLLLTAAMIAAIPVVWGATAILAKPKAATAAPAATSIDVMQMMRNAKDLPEQQFGAY